MHTKNGLWAEVENHRLAQPLDQVDRELARFLRDHAVKLEQVGGMLVRPQLAGNGIHFDRGFIRRCLRRAEAELHHRQLDVTSVNELMRRFCPLVYEARPRPLQSAHRAMDDVLESLSVARHYGKHVTPEQICAEPIDGQTDSYALGCLLYEMATARLPHEAQTVLTILAKYLREHPVPPSQRRPELGLPRELAALIQGAIAKDPAVRPPMMEAFGEQIGGASRGPAARSAGLVTIGGGTCGQAGAVPPNAQSPALTPSSPYAPLPSPPHATPGSPYAQPYVPAAEHDGASPEVAHPPSRKKMYIAFAALVAIGAIGAAVVEVFVVGRSPATRQALADMLPAAVDYKTYKLETPATPGKSDTPGKFR